NEIVRQLQANGRLNLLSKKAGEIAAVDEKFLSALKKARQASAQANDALVDFTVQSLLEVIFSINQYLEIDSSAIPGLKEIYRNTFRDLNDMKAKEVLKRHYNALGKWLSAFYPAHFIRSLEHHTCIGAVENKEYSWEFQVKVLGINTKTILEPVLDIGCGKKALMVHGLRQLGIDAYGIDRISGCEHPFLFRSSWFDFDYECRQWGTIIANMSFSNHAQYAERNAQTRMPHYNAAYSSILTSLKQGGQFIYAPDIPVLEETIDREKYSVSKKQVYDGIYCTTINKKTLCSHL
ncbi:MAG: hypothetical protein JXN62_04250, partial [Bacteroidales bacterium]|nr:hypothetical protein [Bacteroidales bacterium]